MLEQFIMECCNEERNARTPYNEFYDRSQRWLPPNEKHISTK